MRESLRFIDPGQLNRITDLQLLARTVVEGFMAGMHRSPHSGSSVEFAQYRPYTQGDDLRHVDWRLYARTDRLHVKQYEEETTLRCTLLLDCSASMNYTSHDVTKFDYARMLVACLALILQQQRDAAGLIAYHHELLTYVPPSSGPVHMRTLLKAVDNIAPAGQTDTAGALRYLGDVLKPRGMLVLISDLLHPLDEMLVHLRSLKARRQDVIVLQITDPAEQTFPFEASATFVDTETGHEQFAVPEAVRERYLENREEHFKKIKRECLAAEIDIDEFVTSEPLDRALNYFLQRRSQSMLRTAQTRHRVSGRGH